jgi:hypothetical protein
MKTDQKEFGHFNRVDTAAELRQLKTDLGNLGLFKGVNALQGMHTVPTPGEGNHTVGTPGGPQQVKVINEDEKGLNSVETLGGDR